LGIGVTLSKKRHEGKNTLRACRVVPWWVRVVAPNPRSKMKREMIKIRIIYHHGIGIDGRNEDEFGRKLRKAPWQRENIEEIGLRS
jgi:hypothetical protein